VERDNKEKHLPKEMAFAINKPEIKRSWNLK
jgi:hypothetical protein